MPDERKWVIAGPYDWADIDTEERLYWSNEDGWVSKESATVFTTAEKDTANMPMNYAGWDLAS